MVNNTAIGVIDSGIGGLLVLEALRKQMQRQSFIYIADQMHMPYGDKSKEQLLRYGTSMLAFLQSVGVQRVVVACNTLCAMVLDELRAAFPNLQLYDVVELTCSQLQDDLPQRVLVLATQATIATHRYSKEITRLAPRMQVQELAVPAFVPAIEAGADALTCRKLCYDALHTYRQQVDIVVLACTHYPYLSTYIEEILPVTLINSNEVVAQAVSAKEQEDGYTNMIFYTTHDTTAFTTRVHALFRQEDDIRLLHTSD